MLTHWIRVSMSAYSSVDGEIDDGPRHAMQEAWATAELQVGQVLGHARVSLTMGALWSRRATHGNPKPNDWLTPTLACGVRCGNDEGRRLG